MSYTDCGATAWPDLKNSASRSSATAIVFIRSSGGIDRVTRWRLKVALEVGVA